ncbi:uncharacterized protein DS421_13g431130 [Arachis hypogaea]|nr:uncharacterized protein DS421_13g431130 [Arachis hypogaea]
MLTWPPYFGDLENHPPNSNPSFPNADSPSISLLIAALPLPNATPSPSLPIAALLSSLSPLQPPNAHSRLPFSSPSQPHSLSHPLQNLSLLFHQVRQVMPQFIVVEPLILSALSPFFFFTSTTTSFGVSLNILTTIVNGPVKPFPFIDIRRIIIAINAINYALGRGCNGKGEGKKECALELGAAMEGEERGAAKGRKREGESVRWRAAMGRERKGRLRWGGRVCVVEEGIRVWGWFVRSLKYGGYVSIVLARIYSGEFGDTLVKF